MINEKATAVLFGKDYVRSRVSRAEETHRLQRHLSNMQKNRILVYPTYCQPNIHAMHRKQMYLFPSQSLDVKDAPSMQTNVRLL